MSGYRDISKLESTRNCLRRIARHDEQQFSKDSIVNVMEKFVKTVKVMDDTILVPCRLMDRQVGDNSDMVATPGKDSTSNQHTMHSISHSKRSSAHSKNVDEFLHSSELFNLYNTLKVLKNDLLWLGKDAEEDSENEQNSSDMNSIIYARLDSAKSETLPASGDTETQAATAANITNNECSSNSNSNNNGINSSSQQIRATNTGHNRRPSTASLASTVSVVSVSNLSDSESEISNENDSGVESEGNKSYNQQSSSSESVSGSEDAVDTQTKKAANVDKATELAKRCRRHLNGLYQCLEQMTEAANYLTARYQSDIGPV